jgi:acetyltransferase-like isoleucine patch superfamily enzyme
MKSFFKDKYGQNLSWSKAAKMILVRFVNYFLDFKIMLLGWVGHIPSHIIRNNLYRLAGVSIGKGSTIHMWANFYQPRNVSIGNDTIIGNHCFLDGRSKISIGNHTDVASEVMIYNSEHKIDSIGFEAHEEPVSIGDYVFIGPRAIILPGVSLAKGSVVAAGAVVTKSVGEFEIVAGVPAKVIGERKNKNPKYILGRARLFQ